MADDVTITVHVRDLTGPGFQSVNRNLGQLQRQASSMGAQLRIVGGQLDGVANSASRAGGSLGGGMGLRGQAIAAGAALGASLLPTLGALAPMLAGVSVVGGGAALAMGDLKKKAKELEPAFKGWQKAAEKAVAPHTERAVKSLKSAMEDLEPSLVLGAETFGTITERASKFAASPAFQSAFQKNAQMGVVFVEQLAESVGKFTQSFLEFGTKSQPALDAWQELLGGFLDTGLPSMFKELEQGIGGSSRLLSGLASFLNEGFLPALGKVSGSFAEAFGPLVGETLRSTGVALMGLAKIFDGAMATLEPVARIAADALHAFTDVMVIGGEVAGSLARNIGGALVDALLTVSGIDTSEMTGGFTKLSDWVDAHASEIRSVFFDIAHGITTMVTIGLSTLPQLFEGFRWLSESVLDVVGGMLAGITLAFSNLPGMGWLKDVNKEFVEFSSGFRESLDAAGQGIDDFVGTAVPNLNRVQIKLRVDEAEQNLADIKEKLDDPSLTEERKAKLSADKTAAEEELAAAKRDLAAFDQRRADATLAADPRPFFGEAARVKGTTFPKRSVGIGANSGSFWSAIRGISGKVLGTAYINVHQRFVAGPKDSSAAKPFSNANGSIMKFYADGGTEQHVAQIAPAGSWRVWGEPETGGEAYIPLASSKRGRSRQIAEETVDILGGDVEWFAKGGVTKKEAEARKAAASDLTISYFGQRAGFKTTEFAGALGKADSVGELVGALNKWRSVIKQTTHGMQEAKLLKMLKHGGDNLLHHQKALAKVTKSLEKARDKLDSLKDAASALDSSVKGGIISGANITRAATAEDSQVTINTLLSQARGDASQAQAFEDALKQLKKKGVSGRIIEQIAEAGITGGGLETAQALLGADKGQITELNKLNQSIRQSADDAGELAAESLYGAGIKAAEGLVEGLKKKQDKIEEQMLKIAKSMEKAIKKALGIKSPSQVMMRVGDQTAEGFALGMVRNRSVRPAWESMLNVPRPGSVPRTTLPAQMGGGGGQTAVIQLQIGDTQLGEVIIDPVRKAVKTRGGLRATFGGLD